MNEPNAPIILLVKTTSKPRNLRALESCWLVEDERFQAGPQPSQEPAHLWLHIVVWTSLEVVQQAVRQDYVIVWRQKASDSIASAAVVFPEDKPGRPAAATIRRDLEQGCGQLDRR